jgi:ubiquinone/menaquinone biosynthesis C-methylase UbiE
LKRLGHRVVAVDSSSTLIEAARRDDPEGDYRVASATELPLESASCDLVTAFMTLLDVDDLTAAVSEIGRVLVASGTACIAIVHPLNSAGKFEMVFHSRHRLLEAYSRALEASGLMIDAIREHRIPEDRLISTRSRRWQRVPLFLHLRARKPA